ncbi:hypothetical protein [uncultured Rikenella sp.]|uniref:hypothetical protein n=1 Tax=uncultured Rikenella sp. TaxID=368003 RepID=UPI002605E751|nr:hypothetical protein [uncultured Rikenella sp.]
MSSPAPGFRDAGDNRRLGTLCSVGNSGHSYSSSVSGTVGVFLDFYAHSLSPSIAHNRGHGLPLRCLSE